MLYVFNMSGIIKAQMPLSDEKSWISLFKRIFVFKTYLYLFKKKKTKTKTNGGAFKATAMTQVLAIVNFQSFSLIPTFRTTWHKQV